MYQNRVTSYARKDQVFKSRSHNFDLSRGLVLENEEDVGGPHLYYLVLVEPEHLLISFSQHHVGGLKGWGVVTELGHFYPPILKAPVPFGALLMVLSVQDRETGLNPVG